MPWQDVRPMDHRILFIADYLRGGHSLTTLCALHGISRKTGYKWIKRYENEALEGLQDRSRRPQSSPQQVPYAVREAVIALRYRGGAVLGPKKIQALLRSSFPIRQRPSRPRSI
jgi:putative transposase